MTERLVDLTSNELYVVGLVETKPSLKKERSNHLPAISFN